MLIKGIDFPEALLRAHAAGELVVFAGAGVSAPPPSSLPLFDTLAERIGGPTGIQRQPQEPVERYLGRLKKQGVHVHDASARILVNESTKPHPLHENLMQLFTSPEKVRVVTTNFDIHFSTAGRLIFPTPIETFYAPALPLGDDFAGLVYLHGCAAKQSRHCVLTDEDFGRAYLTQAWASRFLSAMFSRYHVLFVGYSHDDTVMSYLARGLPPSNPNARFVFSTEDPHQLEKWRFLGIKPLTYKLSVEENPHGSVSVAMGEWVSELKRGLLEKEQRIRSIAESEPPLEGEDSDYTKLSLSHLPTAQLFCKYARSPRWIIWLEQHDFLKPLFVPYAETGELHRVLALWLTEHFFTLKADHLFGTIRRSGGKLHRILSWFIWRRLCMRDRDGTIGTVFSQWVGVLLSQPHDILQDDEWGQILSHCSLPGDRAAALLLFDFLTKPRIRLKERWLFIEEADTAATVDFDLNLSRDLEHWISQAWDTRIKPNLAAYVAQLEPIVARNLTASHQILEIYGRARVDRDPFYLHRQAISEANENGFRNTIDILIEAGKEIACHWLETNPKQAHAMLDRYQSSDVPILQRLAVFGFGRRGDLSADEKLRWLLDADLVYRFKTDVFEFLRDCYGSATDGVKQELLECVLKGSGQQKLIGVNQRSIDYEIYNFLVWLNRASPGCPLALQTIQALRTAYPDFGEREHPELDYWCGGVQLIDPVGELNLEKVGSQEPEEFLNELLAWKSRNSLDRSRSSYCSAVSAVVAKKPEWGISWVNTLVKRRLNDPDLWACVCQGWRNATLTSEQWRLILGVAETIAAPNEFFQSFVEVLEHGSRRPQDALPDDQMKEAHMVADRIWKLALQNFPDLEAPSHRDWLTTALNHPGGRIAEFWLLRISVARKTAAESWAGLPAQIVSSLTAMIDGKSPAAAMARVIFASQLHYFFALDPQFAATKLLCLFDWHIDAKRAEQCWDGFIFWGRWLPGLTDQLLPHFRETIKQTNKFADETRERLINHVAGISVFRIDNPLADDWLFRILKSLEPQVRVELARAFDRLLEDASPQITESVWERWFKKYWETRLLQIPNAVVTKEANEMVSWPLGFGKYFPEAVQMVLPLGRVVQFDHCDLPYRLQRRNLAKTFPEATGQLLMFYLMTKPKFFHLSNEGLALWKELKLHLHSETLKQIREAMLEIGFDPEGT